MDESSTGDHRHPRIARRVGRSTLPALVLVATLVAGAPADGAVATAISVGDATTCAIDTGGGL